MDIYVAVKMATAIALHFFQFELFAYLVLATCWHIVGQRLFDSTLGN